MKIVDDKWTGEELDLPVMKFSYEEMETTICKSYQDEVIVYSSIRKDISKILSITEPSNIQPLTVNSNGTINSIKAKLTKKNISFRKWHRVYTSDIQKT